MQVPSEQTNIHSHAHTRMHTLTWTSKLYPYVIELRHSCSRLKHMLMWGFCCQERMRYKMSTHVSHVQA